MKLQASGSIASATVWPLAAPQARPSLARMFDLIPLALMILAMAVCGFLVVLG